MSSLDLVISLDLVEAKNMHLRFEGSRSKNGTKKDTSILGGIVSGTNYDSWLSFPGAFPDVVYRLISEGIYPFKTVAPFNPLLIWCL